MAADGDVVLDELDATEGEAGAHVAAEAILRLLVVGKCGFDLFMVDQRVEPIRPAQCAEARDHHAAEFGFRKALGVEAGLAHVGAGIAQRHRNFLLADFEFFEKVADDFAVRVQQLAAKRAYTLEFTGSLDAVFQLLQVVVDHGCHGRRCVFLAERGNALQLARQDRPIERQVQRFEGAAFAFAALHRRRVVVAGSVGHQYQAAFTLIDNHTGAGYAFFVKQPHGADFAGNCGELVHGGGEVGNAEHVLQIHGVLQIRGPHGQRCPGR
ncbi:hypothetical protein D3C87_1210790 [compost metagenome]